MRKRISVLTYVKTNDLKISNYVKTNIQKRIKYLF